MNFSFEIPGARKETIDLKITKEGLRLTAARDENVEYYSEYSFICDGKPDAASAKYDNGILSVTVPYECPDPFKDAQKISIG
jgi:HSP20 family molecular chaperone IbpA